MRRAGAVAAQILKGAKPAEMPFEQATKLELVLNLKAARRLDIDVQPSVRIAADEAIHPGAPAARWRSDRMRAS